MLDVPGKTMKRLVPSFLLLLLVALPLLAEGVWTEVGDLPVPRSSMANAVLGDTLYLIGGSVPGASIPVASSDVVRYNLSRGELLTNAPSLNIPRVGASAVAYEGNIIVFGGRRNDIDYVSEIEAWRPGQEEWSIIGDLPPARAWMSAIVLDNLIYVAGGTYGSLQRYDRIDIVVPYLDIDPPYAAVTTANDSLPSARSHHAMVKFNGSVYLFGGYSNWPLNDCYRWDEDGWTQLSSMVYGVSGMAVAPFRLSQSEILVASGGRTISGEVETLQAMTTSEIWFNPANNHEIENLDVARSGHAFVPVASADNRIVYIFGGSFVNTSGQQVLLNDILTFTHNPTSFIKENQPVQPGDIQLSAHPNPSNGAVTISILPGNGLGGLDVRIFDLLGREVRAWQLPSSRAGTMLSWDGTNAGREVAGGIYFLVARSADQQQVLKLFRMP